MSESTSEDKKFLRTVKSFVIRAGRMSESQKKAFEQDWQDYGLTVADGALDWTTAFGRDGSKVLEIGFGMGHSLIEMAKNKPDHLYVGVEVHTPGVARLFREARSENLENLKAYKEDAIEVLNQCIGDETLDVVQLFFPDPWHKKKHHKRRIVQPEFAQLLRRKLKVGGVFHMATDWENYAEHMMEVMTPAEGFKNRAGENQFHPRPEFRPLTKFEKRGENLGHGVWDLLFEKVK